MTNTNTDRGFIALMSSIIISAILILMVTNTSFTGFYSRFNILDSEIKQISSALADSCIDIALLYFAQNPSYSGNTNVTVGENTCYIGDVQTVGLQKIFKTQGIFHDSYTNLKIILNSADFKIISVEEILTF